MKIKLTILENDTAYLNRVIPFLGSMFSEELEIYAFTDLAAAMACVEQRDINVFLASNAFHIDTSRIRESCGFAYFVDSVDIQSVDDEKAICKYQKAQAIYKQILSIYAECVPNNIGIFTIENTGMKTLAFCSPAGGTGSSTAAAACALALADAGHHVLYLNAETYGEAERFFAAEGHADFSDVIYAVKSEKINRTLKLQSTVKQDASGVYYFSSVQIPLDMMEMQPQDYLVLQNELRRLGSYDYVVLDMDFPLTPSAYDLFGICNAVVMTTDGSDESASKIQRAMRVVKVLDERAESPLQSRMWLLYNQCTAADTAPEGIRVLGEFPVQPPSPALQIAKQLAKTNLFEPLF